MALSPTALSPAAQRYAAAGAVVIAVALAVWLFGRPPAPDPTVSVVAAAEPWPAGREPGAFVVVEVPADSAALFVTPDQLLAGRLPTSLVPAGTVVSAAMLASADEATSAPDTTLLAVAVHLALWPAPGPAPGDNAVLAATAGGCAAAVTTVIDATESALVIEASPDLAAVVGPERLWAWESPPAGWPTCPATTARAAVEER